MMPKMDIAMSIGRRTFPPNANNRQHDPIYSKSQLFTIRDWQTIRRRFYGQLSFRDDGEAVEQYGAKKHHLGDRLPNLEEFWRCHVAPATDRRLDTHLTSGVHPLISKMAQTSYEVYCMIVDALDEHADGEPSPPRYRPCLNVLRFSGDALQLFTALRFTIESSDLSDTNPRPLCLAETLNTPLGLFRDWPTAWQPRRDKLVWYRNMLVHRGRPWFFFGNGAHPYAEDVWPSVVRWERGINFDQLTWTDQIKLFDRGHRERFISLRDACTETVDGTIQWLNDAYGELVQRMQDLLEMPAYRRLWAWDVQT
jgi:hypothetical protein